MEYLILLLFVIVTLLMVRLHKALTSNRQDVELRVAERLAARSHRLIEKGVRIDTMSYSFEKHAAFDEWLFELHEYLDAYETELSEVSSATNTVISMRKACTSVSKNPT